MGSGRMGNFSADLAGRSADRVRLETNSVADRAGACRFRSERNEGSDTPAGFKSTVRVSTAEGEGGNRPMLDEQSIQLSSGVVAKLDRSHLQNVAGLLESGEPFPKHDPNFARPGLASEMDRLAADCDWDFYVVLRSRFPKTDNGQAIDYRRATKNFRGRKASRMSAAI